MIHKFRVWQGKSMYYPTIQGNSYNHYLQIGDAGFFFYGADGKLLSSTQIGGKIMQYVNLNSIDGHELYAGDIVDVINKAIHNGVKVIAWDRINLCYCLVQKDSYTPEWSSNGGDCYLKVTRNVRCVKLGNIYQNKVL